MGLCRKNQVTENDHLVERFKRIRFHCNFSSPLSKLKIVEIPIVMLIPYCYVVMAGAKRQSVCSMGLESIPHRSKVCEQWDDEARLDVSWGWIKCTQT